MATKIIMPKLGMAMTEGIVGKWVAEDGATVAAEQIIAIIMTKKITYELAAPVAGVLHHRARVKENKLIGQTIAFITDPGEAVPEDDSAVPAAAVKAAAPAAKAAAESAKAAAPAEPVAPGGFVVATPSARRLAKDAGIELSFVAGSGSGGRVTEEDVQAYLKLRDEVLITPSARKLADENNIDITRIQGTGSGGRITEEDVQNILTPPAPAAPAAAPAAGSVPFTGMRQMIADNMVASLQGMAQVTVTTDVDVTEFVALRERLKKEFDLTYTDLLVKACAVALRKHPRLNATLEGEEIKMIDEINIGVGVALDEGLIVPVVRNVPALSVKEIGVKVRELAAKARSDSLDMDEISGSTFTITNLGAYGVDVFTPIINPPEVAILGVGRIVEKVVIYKGEVARRFMMVLSLTFDHRLVDGAPAAAFLQTLADTLSHPYFIGQG